jgi:hypothetical protein
MALAFVNENTLKMLNCIYTDNMSLQKAATAGTDSSQVFTYLGSSGHVTIRRHSPIKCPSVQVAKASKYMSLVFVLIKM